MSALSSGLDAATEAALLVSRQAINEQLKVLTLPLVEAEKARQGRLAQEIKAQPAPKQPPQPPPAYTVADAHADLLQRTRTLMCS